MSGLKNRTLSLYSATVSRDENPGMPPLNVVTLGPPLAAIAAPRRSGQLGAAAASNTEDPPITKIRNSSSGFGF
jgi:hypothetical protein